LNRDQRFRKPLLYPFELRGRAEADKPIPRAAQCKGSGLTNMLAMSCIGVVGRSGTNENDPASIYAVQS
jgi:hypothetical protein